MRIIVITGTPGTGKTTIANKLAMKLPDSELIRVTELINERKLYSTVDKFGTRLINMQRLARALKKEISRKKAGTLILEGHLLSDMKIKGATAIVIREHLPVLVKRLEKRKYPVEKIRDNVASEATDYCGDMAGRHYKGVYEFYSRGKDTLRDITALSKGQKRKQVRIDLLEELLPLLQKRRRYAI